MKLKRAMILQNMITIIAAMTMLFVFSLLLITEGSKAVAIENIQSATRVFAELYKTERISDYEKLHSLNSAIRITIIDEQGNVIIDSMTDEPADNQLSNPEIVSAQNGKPKAVLRYSKSLDQRMLFYALKTDGVNGKIFVRSSVSYSIVTSHFNAMLPVYLAMLIALLLVTYILSVKFSNDILKPISGIKGQIEGINSGEFASLPPKTRYSDLNGIIDEINTTSGKLAAAFLKISGERDRVNFILDSMSEAIFAVNSCNILEFFNDYAGINFALNEEDVLNKDVSFLSDKGFIVELFNYENDVKNEKLDIDDRIYNYNARKLNIFERDIKIIILNDITEAVMAEKNRSDFFAYASHELKTPITSIRGFSELLTMQDLDGESTDFAKKINNESLRLVSLIEDMLILTKLESGAPVINETLQIEEVALECKRDLESQALVNDITIEVEGSASLYFSRSQLKDVLTNLMENGIKYNRPGGKVTVSISGGSRPTVRVADTGIGIEKKDFKKIFDRFYRADQARAFKSGGTGLGLSIIKYIMATNKAEISVSSKVGEGSVFTVRFAPQEGN